MLVWLVGGQIAAYFRRRGRAASDAAAEQLTLIRESLMLMRLVKCYLMELFNQARVERQLAALRQRAAGPLSAARRSTSRCCLTLAAAGGPGPAVTWPA